MQFFKVMVLTKVDFRCSREAELLSFFISVKDLPPRLRYEAFMKSWKKVGNRWEPIHTPAGSVQGVQRGRTERTLLVTGHTLFNAQHASKGEPSPCTGK